MAHIINISISVIIFCMIGITGCKQEDSKEIIQSPDGKIKVQVETKGGQVFYSVKKDGQNILNHSKLGYAFRNMSELGNAVYISDITRNSVNETWEQLWGEKRLIENRYEEMVLSFEEMKGFKRTLEIVFRVFDDGLAFRYHIPAQENIDTIIITDELTQFNCSEIKKTWWIPAYREKYYESLYRSFPVTDNDTVCTPLTMELNTGEYVAIHEANLTDYAAMNLYKTDTNIFNCDLTPWSTGEKVFQSAGMYSPWRTITIVDTPGELITSYIGLNLNEPCRIKDASWIKPGKYIGIWWSMHMGLNTWSQGPGHGATTSNAKRYIDFASQHGIDGVLIEGWNKGWDGDWVAHGDQFSFTESYPDFDLEEITQYAESKNVEIIGHHETGGAVKNYEQQMEDAFELYQKYGINAVKTGYVRPKLEGKEFHSSQFGVRHFRKVLETAVQYEIMIDNHEPVMSTGLRRTYPNLMTQEGVRGQEYNAWSPDGGNPPEHTTIVPFTRGLAGPMDFTFGTLNFENPNKPGTRVRTTVAKQLALYVVIYSPLQMASDLPGNYKHREEFEFIKQVPVNWNETKVLDAKVGDFIVIVRKDRYSEDWYLGAITDEKARELKVNLSFLDQDQKYKAMIYKDGPEADWKTNPYDCVFHETTVSSDDSFLLQLAESGGQAIRFKVIR